MKTAFVVFSVLCVSIFVGCDSSVGTGKDIYYRSDGGVTVTSHRHYPNSNTNISRTTQFENQGDYQDHQTAETIGKILEWLFSSNP